MRSNYFSRFVPVHSIVSCARDDNEDDDDDDDDAWITVLPLLVAVAIIVGELFVKLIDMWFVVAESDVDFVNPLE